MFTEVFFIRHAHSVYTPDERQRPLSEKGLKDAARVISLLKEASIDFVYSSPYKRAIQTVEGVARLFNKEIQLSEAFRERQIAEEFVEDFHDALEKLWRENTFSFPGGKSNRIAQERGAAGLQSLLTKHQGKKIAIGTHGNIMALMMNFFDERHDYAFWKWLDMPDIYQLTFNREHLQEVQHIWK